MSRAEWLRTAQRAADASGEIVRRYYGRKLEVNLKADSSPVTKADVEAELAIREAVREAHPRHGFYGEETGRDEGASDVMWLIDPIDGTKSFIRGYPFLSTQIAVREGDELVVGVSDAPVFGTGERAWAIAGEGAWLDGDRLAVSAIAALDRATLSIGNVRALAAGPGWTSLGRLVAGCDRIRGYGDFYHYHLLAAGKIEAVIESEVNVLDVAAVSVIVTAAGGRVTDLNGAPIDLETKSIVASNGRLHDLILDALSS